MRLSDFLARLVARRRAAERPALKPLPKVIAPKSQAVRKPHVPRPDPDLRRSHLL